MRASFTLLIACLLLLVPVLMGPACVPSKPLEPVVTETVIGDYVLRTWLESSERTERTRSTYRYAGEIVNGAGQDIEGLYVVVLVDYSAFTYATRLVDGTLSFGDVSDGATVSSLDTYAISVERSQPFDSSVITYQIVAGTPPLVPDVVGAVDDAGGVLSDAPGDVVLDFPPSAVPATTPIRISPLAHYGGASLLPSATRDFGPNGIVFDEPVTLTLTYDEGELPDGLPETDEGIFMVSLDHATGEFVKTPGSTLDAVANTLTGQIDGFSVHGAAINCAIRDPESGRSMFCPEPVPEAPDDDGGYLDTGFGSNGIAVLDLGSSYGSIRDLAIDDQGRLLLAGENPHAMVAALLPDGSGFDPGFGVNGFAETHPQTDSNWRYIEIAPDGRIWVVGDANEPPPLTLFDLTVGRLLSNGVYDPTFGDGSGPVGVVIEQRTNDYPLGFALLPGGGVIVASPNKAYQYRPNGQPDPAFATNGLRDYGVSGPLGDLVRMANGDYASPTGAGLSYVDPATGDPLGSTGYDEGRFGFARITPAPGGGWATAGMTTLDGDAYLSMAVGLIDPDGRGNTGFGNGYGRGLADFGEEVWVSDVAMQEDGRIVVVGFTNTAGDRDMVIVRFRTDGRLDGGFGTDGVIRIDRGVNDRAMAVEIDAQGRIVVAGYSGTQGAREGVVLRLLP